jgi:NADPH2:quinone reductase
MNMSTMKALVCERLGALEDLVVRELETPRAGAGEVVIDVHAASVNFPDTLLVAGLYQIKPALPFAPGGELAGVVSEVGAGVTELAVGDRVMAFTGFGAFVEKIAVSPAQCAKLPAGLSFESASCLFLTYATTHHALFDRGRLAPGETVLVLGAAGGIGVAGIQLAKSRGARVVAAASTEAKRAFCLAQGADVTLDPGADPKSAFKSIGRVDVVLDPVGGDLTEAALRALAPRGRLLVVGFASGTIPKLPLNLALLKEVDVVGVQWGVFARREREAERAIERDLVRLALEGAIRPPIHASFPLARGAEALGAVARREVMGKVVIRCREPVRARAETT